MMRPNFVHVLKFKDRFHSFYSTIKGTDGFSRYSLACVRHSDWSSEPGAHPIQILKKGHVFRFSPLCGSVDVLRYLQAAFDTK